MAPNLLQLLQSNGFIDPQNHGLAIDSYESHVGQLNTINSGILNSDYNVQGSTADIADIVDQNTAARSSRGSSSSSRSSRWWTSSIR